MEESKLIEQRSEKILTFLKVKYNWIVYILLGFLVWLSVWIRTRNLSGLKDITTGTWTLGPDLDPFLFLRWAKEIVATGSLAAVDLMRYFPLGFRTSEEVLLHPYLIAYFHKFLSFLGLTSSIDYSVVIYPVFLFALTVISFFLFVRIVFVKTTSETNANIIALIASFFLVILPSILPRTIAGIPEKEASGFFFLFLSFYLFIKAWRAASVKSEVIFALLSGLSTAAMAGVWGGYIFIFMTVSISILFAFFLNQINKRKLIAILVWLISSFIVMGFISSRYTLMNLLNSTTTLIPVCVIGLIIFSFVVFHTKIKRYVEKIENHPKISHLPSPVKAVLLAVIVGIILFIVGMILGVVSFSFVSDKIMDVYSHLITPISDRLGLTVAENKQPYFGEWADSFGPMIGTIPLMFWIFFFGSIYLYNHMLRVFNPKERLVITVGYAFFLFAMIFSRYSESSTFNGTNTISILFYLIGGVVLIASFGYYYLKAWQKGDGEKLKEVDFGLIMVFSLFFVSIVSARGAIRLVMLLVPPAAILSAYFVIAIIEDIKKAKDDVLKVLLFVLLAIVSISLIYSAYYFYNVSKNTSEQYAPNIYTQQWQKAMSWVRENTSTDAVFGHWWDYGYWVQSIGNRATVTDGGNAIAYWNYLMGRHALTSPNEKDALEFLYAHNATHFLIDSSDIGKYPAFSTIGSDLKYDRASFLITFMLNKQQIVENKNSTIYLYEAGAPLDEDILYNDNGTRINLPSGKAGLGGILVEKNSQGTVISNPIGIFIYNNKQYRIPFRYAFTEDKLVDFGNGLESGIFLYPSIDVSSGSVQYTKDGALLYLSNKTVHGQLARIYLYKDNNSSFKLVHSEDDFVVAELKNNGVLSKDEDFVQYQGIRGPIRIWEINYPKNTIFKPEYLNTTFPDANLVVAR